jgi:hypothetical protein
MRGDSASGAPFDPDYRSAVTISRGAAVSKWM